MNRPLNLYVLGGRVCVCVCVCVCVNKQSLNNNSNNYRKIAEQAFKLQFTWDLI